MLGRRGGRNNGVTCILPGAVTPDDLIAYTDDEASPAIVAHIRACPDCAATAAVYARQQRRLRRGLARFACPTPQTLTDFEFGPLPPAEQRAVAGHLVDCPRCRDELATLQGFLADDLAPATAPAPDPLRTRVRRVVATLLASPLASPALGQLRGSDAAGPPVYAAGTLRLAVSVERAAPGAPSWALVGLVWREDDMGSGVGGVAGLIAANGERRTTPIDEFGNFSFELIAPGVYGLEAAIGDELIVVNALPVGA